MNSISKIFYNTGGKSIFFILLFTCLVPFSESMMAQDTVYIDPSYSGPGSDGSFSKPYKSWSSVTVTDNTSYLQRRGTSATISSQVLIHRKNNVKIGVFGSGDNYATIKNTTSNTFSITIMASDNCMIDSIDFIGSYDTYAAIRIVDDYEGTVYSCSGNKITNCNIRKFFYGIRIQRVGHTNTSMDSTLVENVRISDIYQDGMFIQGYKPVTNVEINKCYIDSVNMSYHVVGGNPDQSIAGGDGIQVSRVVESIRIRNCTIDRRNSSNKFCIILNDETEGKVVKTDVGIIGSILKSV